LRVLLDTVTLTRMAEDSPRLSEGARRSVKGAEAVVLSVVTPWELAIKTGKGTLTLDRELDAYLGYLIGFWNLDILPVTYEHALAVRELPHHHRDPFDRMLVAQARTVGLTIVTNDPQIGRHDVAVAW
jgi:PIN domain nuclease of toxin-antitoxin system